MATLNNGDDKGDPMENDAEIGLYGGNIELGNESNGNIKGKDN